MRRAAIGLALAVCAAAGGCERKTEYAGLGPWHVKRTRLRQATGRCEPTELPDGRKGTWCFGQPELRYGGQNATVDLYFGGTEPDAKVIEIQLGFRGCNEEPLDSWVRKTFGAPYEQHGARAFFRNSGAYVIADLPESPGRCTVRMLPRSETAEVERLAKDADAKQAPTPTPEAGTRPAQAAPGQP